MVALPLAVDDGLLFGVKEFVGVGAEDTVGFDDSDGKLDSEAEEVTVPDDVPLVDIVEVLVGTAENDDDAELIPLLLAELLGETLEDTV